MKISEGKKSDVFAGLEAGLQKDLGTIQGERRLGIGLSYKL